MSTYRFAYRAGDGALYRTITATTEADAWEIMRAWLAQLSATDGNLHDCWRA